MTTDITELAQRMKAAAEKATPGEWWADEVKNEGCYGSGDDCVEGFTSYAIYGSDGQTLFDSLNSDAACISEEYDGEGHVAWDETAQSNAEFIAPLTLPTFSLVEALEKAQTINAAAEKLVRCKGRYHSEQNYRALAALFGVTTPDLPPLDSDPVVQPMMFIDGDISSEDADKLAKVIREFNEEDERPLAKMARIIRENPHPTNECDMPKAQPAPVITFYRDGIEAAAKWIDQQREAYDSEHGWSDPDTGTFEFGTDSQRDYSSTLEELAEGIRALHPNAGMQPAPVVPEEATPDSIEILASARRRDHAVFQWDEDQRNAAADSGMPAAPPCSQPPRRR